MKSTGITRRIDDLGRIVIPKEIRKNLKIKENELLEIFIENENIILKKFSSFNDMEKLLEIYVDVLSEITNGTILITNRDKIINANKKYDYLNKDISKNIIDIMLNREDKLSNSNLDIEIVQNNKIKTNYYIKTIINNSDIIGSLILLKNKEINEKDINSINVISKLIVNYLG